MRGRFDEQGVRFRYPPGWDVEVEADDSRANIMLSAPDGLAFAVLRLNEDRPDPSEVAAEALEAIREEYPELETSDVAEEIDGHEVIGYDGEFFSLDMVNGCLIRCFRTERRTVLLFGQWSDVGEEDAGVAIRSLGRTIEETDAYERPGEDE